MTRALTKVVDPSGDAVPLAVKVPEVTALFWMIKITSTAMGEALADFLDGPANVILAGLGSLLAAALFVYALRRQFRTRHYTTGTYWFAVAMVATFGTMAADSLHQFLGLPYWSTTAFYAVVLVLVLWRWWANEGTLSIHSITTRRREHFYWATVLATFALGTATGDWTATGLHLGFLSSGLLFAVAITLPLIAYRLGANSILTFWVAYVLTRPLGASFADWFDYPKGGGGLGVHRVIVWSALALVMTGLVLILGSRERDPLSNAAPHRHEEAGRLGADEHPHPHVGLHPHLHAQPQPQLSGAGHEIHPRPEPATD
ncbi:MAG TPA: hypothetical protein VME70_16480 [Mycobacteriales bacterium]|nr:hypothetical protein [Mycobacteriales bacterium]